MPVYINKSEGLRDATNHDVAMAFLTGNYYPYGLNSEPVVPVATARSHNGHISCEPWPGNSAIWTLYSYETAIATRLKVGRDIVVLVTSQREFPQAKTKASHTTNARHKGAVHNALMRCSAVTASAVFNSVADFTVPHIAAIYSQSKAMHDANMLHLFGLYEQALTTCIRADALSMLLTYAREHKLSSNRQGTLHIPLYRESATLYQDKPYEVLEYRREEMFTVIRQRLVEALEPLYAYCDTFEVRPAFKVDLNTAIDHVLRERAKRADAYFHPLAIRKRETARARHLMMQLVN